MIFEILTLVQKERLQKKTNVLQAVANCVACNAGYLYLFNSYCGLLRKGRSGKYFKLIHSENHYLLWWYAFFLLFT